MTLLNVTMDDNTTTVPAANRAYGIFLDDSIQFANDTLANNTIRSSDGTALTGATGGIGMENSSYVEHFKNTILSTTGAPDCNKASATFVSAGGNIESGTSCGFTLPSDQQNTNAQVKTVADNGGPVQTAALPPGSAAIDHGVSAGCPPTDARGVPRPLGHCDVGAFQLGNQGYWMVASDGGIFSFGNAAFYGSTGSIRLNSPIVAMAATPDGHGYWMVAADGGIFAFGDAAFYGSMATIHLNLPIVGMAATPDGHGYWLVASDGGIFSFGDAGFHGSTGAIHLNKPIVGMSSTTSGNGYWLVASDGGVFSFGDAVFHGSTGAIHLNKPVVGMATTASGGGYWLVATDGGIFSFGDATFYGSTGALTLNKPVNGMARTPTGFGYWLFASDGGVFAFGNAAFLGSMGAIHLNQPVVGGAAYPVA
jgi:hypothetical protein